MKSGVKNPHLSPFYTHLVELIVVEEPLSCQRSTWINCAFQVFMSYHILRLLICWPFEHSWLVHNIERYRENIWKTFSSIMCPIFICLCNYLLLSTFLDSQRVIWLSLPTYLFFTSSAAKSVYLGTYWFFPPDLKYMLKSQ